MIGPQRNPSLSRNMLADRMLNRLPLWAIWGRTISEFETPFGHLTTRQSSIMWALRRLELSEMDHSVAGVTKALALDPRTDEVAIDDLLAMGFLSVSSENPERFLTTTRGV